MKDIIRISKKNKEEKVKLAQKIINFIKYHNGFTFGIFGIFIAMSSVLAVSPQVREAIIGKEVITEQGIDNAQLLSADTENFDINLKINNVSEDEENYYIDYSFNTIAVRDNIWQPFIKVEKFTANKTALGDRDLGIYLAEELYEVVRGEIAYLKEAQKNEKERGLTHIVKTTDYTGLIGLTLDLKNKILSDYEPVVKPEERIENTEDIMDTHEPEQSSVQGTAIGDMNGYSDISTSTTEDAGTMTPEQNAYYQDLIDQATELINEDSSPAPEQSSVQGQNDPSTGSGQATELINTDSSSTSQNDIIGNISSTGDIIEGVSPAPDLIDQAIEVLDQGQQEQQIIDNLKQELTIE